MSLLYEVSKVYEQFNEGAITYMEAITRIVELMPPPCDEPHHDDVYKYLMRGLIDSAEAERRENARHMSRQEAVRIINASNSEIDANVAFAHYSDEQMVFEAMRALHPLTDRKERR